MSLTLTNISAEIGGFRLKNINIEIRERDYHLLAGPSGAGKSLLLELICGVYKPYSGMILNNGREITFNSMQSRGIGLLFQGNTLFPHLNVFNNIAYSLKIKGIDKNVIIEKVNGLAEEMGVSTLLNRYPESLSGGEVQRVALARILANDPEVLLLDEPLNAIDTEIKTETLQILKKLNEKGMAIVHVTHDINEALSLAKYVTIMNNGEIVQSGKAVDVFSKPANKFVASYCGIKNFLECSVYEKNGVMMMCVDNIKYPEIQIYSKRQAGRYKICLYNNDIDITGKQSGEYCIMGVIKEITPILDRVEVLIDAGKEFFLTVNASDFDYTTGETLMLYINPASYKFLERIND